MGLLFPPFPTQPVSTIAICAARLEDGQRSVLLRVQTQSDFRFDAAEILHLPFDRWICQILSVWTKSASKHHRFSQTINPLQINVFQENFHWLFWSELYDGKTATIQQFSQIHLQASCHINEYLFMYNIYLWYLMLLLKLCNYTYLILKKLLYFFRIKYGT